MSGVEQTLGVEFSFECFEAGLEVAETGGFGAQDDDLQAAACFIDGGLSEDADFGAILQGLMAAAFAGTEHGALDLGVVVLQREIPMTAGLFFEVANFPLDPDLADFNFDDVFDASEKLRDGDGFDVGHEKMC